MKEVTPISRKVDITRGLPKTGQVTSYQAGDDGTYEAGWWVGRINSNNRTRFIIKTIAGDDVVIDRATGLIWARNGNAAGGNNGNVITWANGINYANGLTFAGFSDWRIPNIAELFSIINFSRVTPAVYIDFFQIAATVYWSSTSFSDLTGSAWIVEFNSGQVSFDSKTFTRRILCARGGL